ncbi:MAG: thermonuclease family protein [Pseudomonadota bacterium]
MLRSGLLAVALMVVMFAQAAQSKEIRGAAIVVDGDTLQVGGQQVRLLGIDAFEGAQELPLKTGGTDFLGRGAAMMLRSLITSKAVVCELSELSDGRGLPLATCYSNETDLARELVLNGIALAAQKHGSTYLNEQETARARKRGFWRDEVETPWVFRDRRVNEAAKTAPASCPFKGVVLNNRKTLITPWSPWYAETSIERARGDNWFCNERQAVAEGWYEPTWLIQSVVSGVYNPGQR